MAWRRPDSKPLSEPMMVRLLTHICITRHQWVNPFRAEYVLGNIKIYLHFLSFLDTQVVKILPHERQGPMYLICNQYHIAVDDLVRQGDRTW